MYEINFAITVMVDVKCQWTGAPPLPPAPNEETGGGDMLSLHSTAPWLPTYPSSLTDPTRLAY